jgi:Arc/MetJ family transcription regulator
VFENIEPSASTSASYDARIDAEPQEESMRTTVNLDDALLEQAQKLSGVKERSALMREALEALIQRESARRLARLGATEPQLRTPRRRRSPAG